MSNEKTKHLLKTELGYVIGLTLDEGTGRYEAKFTNPEPLVGENPIDHIQTFYFPWRDRILRAWSRRTGKTPPPPQYDGWSRQRLIEEAIQAIRHPDGTVTTYPKRGQHE